MATSALGTRAVLRVIEAGDSRECVRCGRWIMFSARDRTLLQVVANVYERGSWARVEHYHETCYQDAGAPYGPPPPPQTARFRAPGQLPPAHVLTTLGAGGQTVQGTCRCGWGWSGGSADDVSDAWATHVADSAPALF